MSLALRFQLSTMMFLQYSIWGAWFVTFETYLGKGLQLSGEQIGHAYGTTAIAAIVSPFFIGLIADRFFATERVLAALHFLGGIVMLYASTLQDFSALYGLLIACALLYMPTLALTNSLTLRQLTDPESEFPGLRVLGTIGWIIVGLVVSFLAVEATAIPMQIAGGLSLATAVFCLFPIHLPKQATQLRPNPSSASMRLNS